MTLLFLFGRKLIILWLRVTLLIYLITIGKSTGSIKPVKLINQVPFLLQDLMLKCRKCIVMGKQTHFQLARPQKLLTFLSPHHQHCTLLAGISCLLRGWTYNFGSSEINFLIFCNESGNTFSLLMHCKISLLRFYKDGEYGPNNDQTQRLLPVTELENPSTLWKQVLHFWWILPFLFPCL